MDGPQPLSRVHMLQPWCLPDFTVAAAVSSTTLAAAVPSTVSSATLAAAVPSALATAITATAIAATLATAPLAERRQP